MLRFLSHLKNKALLITALLVSMTFEATAQSQEIDVEPNSASPVFPAVKREIRQEGVIVETDSVQLLVPDSIRALSESLIKVADIDALVSPGAPSVVLRHHVESPHEAGVYIPGPPEKIDTANYNWWYLLKHKRLDINDKRVIWPKGTLWSVQLYNKINNFVNGYDSVYIASTGKHGRIRLVSDNWSDQYTIRLDKETRLAMASRPFYTLGINVSYLGVGYTYALDLSNIIGNRPVNHSQHRIGFGTQMFQFDFKHNSSKGGTIIKEFSKVPPHVMLDRYFPGVEMKTWSLTGYYFFNNRRYSQGAAYSFSKFQKKSAGTFLAGLSYARSDFFFDFTKLPDDLLLLLTQEAKQYRFHYRNISLLGGYAYNFVLHRRLLLNLFALPGIGLNKCFKDSHESKRSMAAVTMDSGMSLVYNNDYFFMGFDTKWNMMLYHTKSYSLLSSILNFSISLGRRF